MPITASVVVGNVLQPNGMRRIAEKHTDHTGRDHFRFYTVPGATDVDAAATARGPVIAAELAATEVSANLNKLLNGLSDIVLVHSTAAQNRTAVRAAYRDLTGWDAIKAAKGIAGLNLNDTQLKSIWGLTDPQLVTLKAKLANAVTTFDNASAEVGA